MDINNCIISRNILLKQIREEMIYRKLPGEGGNLQVSNDWHEY